jgi:hypothetical protein
LSAFAVARFTLSRRRLGEPALRVDFLSTLTDV